MWLLLGFLIVAGAVYLLMRNRDDASGHTFEPPTRRPEFDGDLGDGPSNPRFRTWEEAFNRKVTDDLRFAIEYADFSGELSNREITPKSIHLERGEPWLYIKAHCHLRNEERTFRSDRIQSARNLKSKRAINDLGQYLRTRY